MVKRLSVGFGRSIQNSLKRGNSSPDGKAVSIARPRRKAINLTCTNHAEIAGPEHADDFIVFIFAVDRVKHFKTGKTKVFYRVFVMLNIAESEIIRAVFDSFDCGWQSLHLF